MHGSGEAHTVIISVVNCIEELHEDVSENMQLFEAFLIDAERLDNVSAAASFRVFSVDLPCYPMVRWQIIIDSINHVSQVGES